MSRASSPLSDAGSTDLSLFTEPASFRPATPPPSTAHFTLPPAPPSLGLSSADGAAQDILLHLVGAHPLWGHHLWNAAPVLSRFLNAHAPTLLAQRSVLELGAAAGLPCVVARKRGAATTVASDWPDIELLANLRRNVEAVGGIAEGFVWGTDPAALLSHLPCDSSASAAAPRFDLLLLSDLVFNHQAHPALLKTLYHTLSAAPSCASVSPQSSSQSEASASARSSSSSSATADEASSSSPRSRSRSTAHDAPPEGRSAAPQTPCALVFFSHHRPQLAHKDMRFLALARKCGWRTEEVGRWRMPPMFENDPGDKEVRGTVHGWRIWREEGQEVVPGVKEDSDDEEEQQEKEKEKEKEQ